MSRSVFRRPSIHSPRSWILPLLVAVAAPASIDAAVIQEGTATLGEDARQKPQSGEGVPVLNYESGTFVQSSLTYGKVFDVVGSTTFPRGTAELVHLTVSGRFLRRNTQEAVSRCWQRPADGADPAQWRIRVPARPRMGETYSFALNAYRATREPAWLPGLAETVVRNAPDDAAAIRAAGGVGDFLADLIEARAQARAAEDGEEVMHLRTTNQGECALNAGPPRFAFGDEHQQALVDYQAAVDATAAARAARDQAKPAPDVERVVLEATMIIINALDDGTVLPSVDDTARASVLALFGRIFDALQTDARALALTDVGEARARVRCSGSDPSPDLFDDLSGQFDDADASADRFCKWLDAEDAFRPLLEAVEEADATFLEAAAAAGVAAEAARKKSFDLLATARITDIQPWSTRAAYYNTRASLSLSMGGVGFNAFGDRDETANPPEAEESWSFVSAIMGRWHPFGYKDTSLPDDLVYSGTRARWSVDLGFVFGSDPKIEGQELGGVFLGQPLLVGIGLDLSPDFLVQAGVLFFEQTSTNPLNTTETRSRGAIYLMGGYDLNLFNWFKKKFTEAGAIQSGDKNKDGGTQR